MTAPDKASVHAACVAELATRRTRLTEMLARIAEARAADTKSSAGDKFETGREMLQREENQLREQLARLATAEAQVFRLDPARTGPTVELGSLVATNRGLYYLGPALGKLTVAGQAVFCLSAAAPLARQLWGARAGDTVGAGTQVQGVR